MRQWTIRQQYNLLSRPDDWDGGEYKAQARYLPSSTPDWASRRLRSLREAMVIVATDRYGDVCPLCAAAARTVCHLRAGT